MAKLSVIYVGLCEMTFALMAGALGAACISAASGRDLIFGFEALAIAALSAVSSYGLFCAKRWAWYCSWVVGLVVVAISSWAIHAAMQPDPYGDFGGAGVIGLACLLFALPAFVLMSLSPIRRYLRVAV